MGTNYYLHQKPDCECCGRPYEPLHIGKSSHGWCFALHVDPEAGINTIDDWRPRWTEQGAFIHDEYGETISIAEMELIIAARLGRTDWDGKPWWGSFYTSESDFHAKNYSERGPNGLLRHRIDGQHCIGHGDGTWDHITGSFS